MAVVVEVCELIGPLRDDSKRIFEESNDDEEATNAREVSSIGRELAMFSDSPSPRGGRCVCVTHHPTYRESSTHGLMGSATVSSMSSSLLVCALN
jgi:hypothetical protein